MRFGESPLDFFLFRSPSITRASSRSSFALSSCLTPSLKSLTSSLPFPSFASTRNSLLDRYATLELREYRRIFRSTDEVSTLLFLPFNISHFPDFSIPSFENSLTLSLDASPFPLFLKAGQLDNIARRYAWFRRILKAHDDDRERIFPESWKVGLHLCARFAEVTRFVDSFLLFPRPVSPSSLENPTHRLTESSSSFFRARSQDLSNVLAKVSPLSVGLLMESLQATLAFEQQMSKKYNLPVILLSLSSFVLLILPPSTFAATRSSSIQSRRV